MRVTVKGVSMFFDTAGSTLCPILIASGELDPIFPVEFTASFECCPDSRILRHPHAAHGVLRDATKDLLDTVRDLVADLPDP